MNGLLNRLLFNGNNLIWDGAAFASYNPIVYAETPPRPVPAWAGWRRNLFRRSGALGGVNPEPLATGFGRHRAGVVDADVAAKWGNPVTSVVQSSTCDCSRLIVVQEKQRSAV
jgi:hypothetical protein